MTTVFLGGSRHISRLNDEVRARIDNMIERGFPIVIGDANGADKALQSYLKARGYRNVQVYCSGSSFRFAGEFPGAPSAGK
jgi:predicted Rossmann fold nucleotide-binding protein DprA/Smf involved in DNA uptake